MPTQPPAAASPAAASPANVSPANVSPVDVVPAVNPPPARSPAGRSAVAPPRGLVRYLADLSGSRFTLWCYFAYWSTVVVHYFDASPRLWLTSLGLSGIIGTALYISTARAGSSGVALGFWPTARLFLMPFCVSSFSALARPHGFVLIFHPTWAGAATDVSVAAAACLLLRAGVLAARRRVAFPDRPPPTRVTSGKAGDNPPGPDIR